MAGGDTLDMGVSVAAKHTLFSVTCFIGIMKMFWNSRGGVGPEAGFTEMELRGNGKRTFLTSFGSSKLVFRDVDARSTGELALQSKDGPRGSVRILCRFINRVGRCSHLLSSRNGSLRFRRSVATTLRHEAV